MAQIDGRVKAGAASASAAWTAAQPALVSLVLLVLLAATQVILQGGDPLGLARLGTRYNLGDPNGSEGYDGQFVYYIAQTPDPELARPKLDVPAYRYQRILLPLLARALSLGNSSWLAWSLVALGVLSQAAGVWAVARLMESWASNRWYALVYGLFAGFTLSVSVFLPEPLAYSLVAWGLYAHLRDKPLLSAALLGLALFAKETVIFFPLAVLAEHLWRRRWREAALLAGVTFLPFALFQLWLWRVFGQPGIGSGGAMATSFELIPFWGLLQIGRYSLFYLLMMLVVFAPAVILPVVWGLWSSIQRLLKGEGNFVVFALLANAAILPFLPFSTYRETGGLIRFCCGLALAVELFSACYRRQRAMNYSIFWIVLNVFLLK